MGNKIKLEGVIEARFKGKEDYHLAISIPAQTGKERYRFNIQIPEEVYERYAPMLGLQQKNSRDAKHISEKLKISIEKISS